MKYTKIPSPTTAITANEPITNVIGKASTEKLMFSGIYIASKVIKHNAGLKNKFSEKKKTIYFTGFATIFRTAIMPIIDYSILYSVLLPLVFGTAIPETYIIALVPSFVLYHTTSTLYVVPIAYFIAKRTSKYLEIETCFPIQV